MKQHKTQILIAFLLFAASNKPAAAQGGFSGGGGNGFGAPGQIAITGEFEGHLHNGWEIRLHPSLDYFIANNISVGGLLGISYASGNPSRTVFDFGARAGYNINIVDRLSFWPRV